MTIGPTLMSVTGRLSAFIRHRKIEDGDYGPPDRVLRTFVLRWQSSVASFVNELRYHGLKDRLLSVVLDTTFPLMWCSGVFRMPYPPVPVMCGRLVLNRMIELRDSKKDSPGVSLDDEWRLWSGVYDGWVDSRVSRSALADLLVQNGTLSESWREEARLKWLE